MSNMPNPIDVLKEFADECRKFAAEHDLSGDRFVKDAIACRERAKQHRASADAADRAIALLEAAAKAGA